jgi:hypothetical protein
MPAHPPGSHAVLLVSSLRGNRARRGQAAARTRRAGSRGCAPNPAPRRREAHGRLEYTARHCASPAAVGATRRPAAWCEANAESCSALDHVVRFPWRECSPRESAPDRGILVLSHTGTFHFLHESGEWISPPSQTLREMPFERKRGSVCDLDGATYVLGRWGRTGRPEAARVSHDGRIYIAGGISGVRACDDVDVHDVRARLKGKMFLLRPRRMCCAAYVGDGLLVFGGIGAAGDVLAHAEFFSDGRDVAPPMHAPRAAAACAVMGDTVYVAGGIAGMHADVSTAERFDARQKKWHPLPPMPRSRSHRAGAAMGNFFYVIALLSSDELCVLSETHVAQALCAWCEANAESCSALDHVVRFPWRECSPRESAPNRGILVLSHTGTFHFLHESGEWISPPSQTLREMPFERKRGSVCDLDGTTYVLGRWNVTALGARTTERAGPRRRARRTTAESTSQEASRACARATTSTSTTCALGSKAKCSCLDHDGCAVPRTSATAFLFSAGSAQQATCSRTRSFFLMDATSRRRCTLLAPPQRAPSSETPCTSRAESEACTPTSRRPSGSTRAKKSGTPYRPCRAAGAAVRAPRWGTFFTSSAERSTASPPRRTCASTSKKKSGACTTRRRSAGARRFFLIARNKASKPRRTGTVMFPSMGTSDDFGSRPGYFPQ